MKKFIGYGFSILIFAGAMLFEMSESIVFWQLAFKDEDWYLGYLGFFLTSISMLGYFYDFLFKASGRTQKTVSLVMAIVSALGSIATAGFGFKISTFDKYGFEFTASDIQIMAILVMVLVAVHIAALFVYYGGDAIAEAWKDKDGNGVPDILEKPLTPFRQMHSDTAEIDALKKRLDELQNPTNANTKAPRQ